MFDDVKDIAAEHLYPNEPEQTVSHEQSNIQTTHDSQKEINVRMLRERAEAAEKRAFELERMMQMNMSQQQTNKMQVTEEDDFDLNDDTYIEGKHLKKYVKNLKQELRNTKKQFEEYNQQQALDQAEMKLKNQFSDFDAVVSKENIEKLAQQKPALYRTMMASPDIYDRGYSAYEIIKNSGIFSDQYNEVDKKLEENRSKPRSAANASPQSSDTPLTRVGDYDRRILSEERKDQLRRQVEEAKRMK